MKIFFYFDKIGNIGKRTQYMCSYVIDRHRLLLSHVTFLSLDQVPLVDHFRDCRLPKRNQIFHPLERAKQDQA